MNAEQQELFDLAILRVLDRNRTRFGLSVTAIGFQMREFGFAAVDVETLKDRLDYLSTHPAGKPFTEEVNPEINRAKRCWRITDDGINHMDQRG